MTTQEIIQNNKLIAEFMLYDDVDCSNCIYTRDCNWFQCNLTPIEKDEQLKYNSSWDWLMPVVENIESLGHGVTIYRNGCQINDIFITVFNGFNNKSKINETYKAVIEFIKWYNENK